MAIPSGSGSEVLRNAAVNANNDATAIIDWGGTTGTGSVRSSGNSAGVINVPTDVIITVLNIICYSAADQTVDAKIDWQGGGTIIQVFNQTLVAGATFVYSDRIVLREGDELQVTNTSSWADWSVNFIYQDWT